MTFDELREQSKKAVIARLQDDNVKLEWKCRFIENNWIPYNGNVFCLDTFYYRIAKPKSKYRVGLAGGGTYAVDNEVQANMVENFLTFERWLTDWVEYES